MRLHWTHPDWRPWRWYAAEPAPRERDGPRGDDAVPVVDGVRLVKLPWTHPKWRPWHRYAKPERAGGGLEEALEGALEVVVRPERFPWARLVLAALLLAVVAVGGLQGYRAWQAGRGDVDGEGQVFGE